MPPFWPHRYFVFLNRSLRGMPPITEFKDFLLKQNIVALAMAVVVGTALNTLVKAVVDDFIIPIVAAVGPGGSGGRQRVERRLRGVLASAASFATGQLPDRRLCRVENFGNA